MKKSVLLFALFIVAIVLFKMSSVSTEDTHSKELVSLSDTDKIAKN